MFSDKSLPTKARKSSRSPLNPVEFQHTLSLGSNAHVCCHHHKGVPATRKKTGEEKRNVKLEKTSPGDRPINTSIKQKGSNINYKTSCKHHLFALLNKVATSLSCHYVRYSHRYIYVIYKYT